MSSTDSSQRLSQENRLCLLDNAHASIKKGLCGEKLKVDLGEYTQTLQERGAAFVTLHIKSDLRGCIGSLQAQDPLIVDVVRNAYSAAFDDPRFPALTWPEFEHLELHVSVLGPANPMVFASEQELIQQLRPGIDGLILEEGNRRGTFLPSVWESLPDPYDFIAHLKRKAGLESDYWSDTLRVSRYITESFP